ncbi:1,4-dihydroxy-2-naphthoate polyprenyltransferase [Micrococcales bacterium 31B]|nr:1,4-dihydroxy-2-naphthoate polyprenyltransferase [Micrococcales bacterium 31B]
MATLQQWIAGARPRTLPAAVAPVAAGTGAALEDAHVGLALLALGLALALQVGVNYANDYSDGIRGTDDDRVGPFRLTGSRAAEPAAVKRAALLSLGVGAVFGLALVALSGQWWLVLVGAAAIAAAWFYTGGRRPYGYLGLGEVFVFVFFGLVAVLGTTYTQRGSLTLAAVAASVGVGALACAILVANNLRDIPTDRVSGKITLAVRLGDRGTRTLYVALVGVAFAAAIVIAAAHPLAWFTLLCAPLAVAPVRLVLSGARGRDLIAVLGGTGRLELVYALLLLVALQIGARL